MQNVYSLAVYPPAGTGFDMLPLPAFTHTISSFQSWSGAEVLNIVEGKFVEGAHDGPRDSRGRSDKRIASPAKNGSSTLNTGTPRKKISSQVCRKFSSSGVSR